MAPPPPSPDALLRPGLLERVFSPDGLEGLHLDNGLCTARIFLQGAHLAEFATPGGPPWLFLSRNSAFAPGKPIRGGVPLVFPWFAENTGQPDLPLHGLARIRPWQWVSGSVEQNRPTVLRFESPATLPGQPDLPCDLAVTFTLGDSLEIAFEGRNPTDLPVEIETAFHTYFAVADVRAVSILGLEEREFADKTRSRQVRREPAAPLRIEEETDRVYTDAPGPFAIRDEAGAREFLLTAEGSCSAVVWNPWIAKASRMPDFGDDEWKQMLCLETGNLGPAALRLGPGESFRQVLRCELRPSP